MPDPDPEQIIPDPDPKQIIPDPDPKQIIPDPGKSSGSGIFKNEQTSYPESPDDSVKREI